MLFQLLERRGADDSARPALVHAGETHTWGQLLDQTSRLSHGLSDLGMGPADTVALVLPNSAPFLISLLSLSRLGAQVLPLGAELTSPEIHAALESAACTTLIADDFMADLCRDVIERKPGMRVLQVSREDFGLPSLRRMAVEGIAARMENHAAAALPFLHLRTSGSTGISKRVVRSHTSLAAMASAYCGTAGIVGGDRILCVTPIHHGMGFSTGLLAALFSGATLILEKCFDRRNTLRLLAEQEVTAFAAPPFVYSVMADTRTPGEMRFPSLRLAISSGAPLHRDVWDKVLRRFGIRLRQLYGASETGFVSMNLDSDPEAAADSAGHPLPRVEISISHESAEIAVRSPWIASWVAGPETGGRLLALPDAGGWIRPGDFGRLDSQGRLYLTGRNQRFLNNAGRKINPAEVEEVLCSHPSVTKASVIPLHDGLGNESAKAVVYCSIPCAPEALAAYCRNRLAPYKVPRLIDVRPDALRLK
ncbi:MAG: acyl--CoA ligase [Acidobacteria bacterium]|nr:acyl--CoA ligase [Acidobacteriota bacterium]